MVPDTLWKEYLRWWIHRPSKIIMLFIMSVNMKGDYMEIKTNKELAQAVNDIIIQSGIKKTFLSDKLGISRQALDNMLAKKHFSIDDANKILSLIGYTVETSIKKIENIQLK